LRCSAAIDQEERNEQVDQYDSRYRGDGFGGLGGGDRGDEETRRKKARREETCGKRETANPARGSGYDPVAG
jgi:hypothetical protein